MSTAEIALKVVGLLGTASKQPNELGRFITDFTDATINWIRPLFLIDDKEDLDFSAFKLNPEDEDSKEIVVAKVRKAMNANEAMTKDFLNLFQRMTSEGISPQGITNNVHGDKNNFFQNASGSTINITNQ